MQNQIEKRMNISNNTRQRLVAVASILCAAMAGSALAQEPEKGIIELRNNYGPSGVISSVTGVSGATDSVVLTFTRPMNPGTFGMGTNFSRSWTKTWNEGKNVLTVGNVDFSGAADPTLIVYLMQKDADRKDISEPNIFKFQDVNVIGTSVGNGQANVDFDILSADGKGYSVYLSKSQTGRFKRYDQVNFNSKGVHIKGLKNGETNWVYIEYVRNGVVATRTVPVAITAQ